MEERCFQQLGAGIQLLAVFFTSCTCHQELGTGEGGSPGYWTAHVVINKTVLPRSQKAGAALKYCALFVVYDCMLKFETCKDNDKTVSVSGASFVVYLILSV